MMGQYEDAKEDTHRAGELEPGVWRTLMYHV
jgi:hypothetical protein